MEQIWPERWKDYRLLDFGEGQRLEQWGEVLLIRPDIYATQTRKKPALWSKAHATFTEKGKQSGVWNQQQKLPKNWTVAYPIGQHTLRFSLQLTRFKHVGLFPEQAANWDWMAAQLQAQSKPQKVLNLFAYTGGASLAAKACGADVTHVDSIKQVVSWSKENMLLSGLQDIRWTVEDALKFAKREAKRGNSYGGIIMDPPSFGRGPKGERWKIADLLPELLQASSAILDPTGWLIFNTYSGLDERFLKRQVERNFAGRDTVHEQLCLKSEYGGLLQTGTVLKIGPLR